MVRFETKFSNESSRALNRRAIAKLSWVYVLFSVLFAVLGVVWIIGALTDGEAEQGEKIADLVFGCIFVAFGLAFKPLTAWLTKIIQKNVDASMSIMSGDTTEIYTFDENGLVIETEKTGIYKSRVEATYKYVFRIEEDAECYYLFISKLQSHVVFKKYLAEGTLAEMQGYISANFNSVKGNSKGTVYYNK